MKTAILVIAVFLCGNILAQDFCAIKLVDAYSYEQIEASQIKLVSMKKYHIDSTDNLIILQRPKGKKITFVAANYEKKEIEVDFKKHYGDTITVQIKPVDSIIHLKFNHLYANSGIGDTINFETLEQVDTKLNIYLNYLSALNGMCDNGMCNYANTYSFIIEFIAEERVYKIGSITILQPKGYECVPLNEALNRLKNSFPKFRLNGENDKLRKRFTITL